MSTKTQADKQNLFFSNNFNIDICKNTKKCINCEKKNFFLEEENIENKKLEENVQNILHENYNNFLYLMKEILCLCKQHNK